MSITQILIFIVQFNILWFINSSSKSHCLFPLKQFRSHLTFEDFSLKSNEVVRCSSAAVFAADRHLPPPPTSLFTFSPPFLYLHPYISEPTARSPSTFSNHVFNGEGPKLNKTNSAGAQLNEKSSMAVLKIAIRKSSETVKRFKEGKRSLPRRRPRLRRAAELPSSPGAEIGARGGSLPPSTSDGGGGGDGGAGVRVEGRDPAADPSPRRRRHRPPSSSASPRIASIKLLFFHCFPLRIRENLISRTFRASQILAPRVGYLPLLIPHVKPHFGGALPPPPGVDTVWFDYNGLPLKW